MKHFEAIAEKYNGIITKLAHSFSLSDSETDDLFQEGLIALYRAFVTYDGTSASFSTYASVCIKNSMVSWIRKNRTPNEVYLEDIDEFSQILTSTENLEDKILSDDFFEILKENADLLLSKREQEVFELFLQDKKSAEIAKALGLQGKSVENTLYRIKAKLRKGLKFQD